MDLGQAEAALSDCNSALRLDPHGPGAFICRAKCYRALGQLENARADARRVVEVTEKNTDYFWARDYRLSAFAILGQPQEAAELALAVFTNERLRDWAPVLEANVEMERIPQKAFALAMARWKLGDKDQARRWYEKGVQWMDKKQNPDPLHFLDDKDLPRFRDEAAALLGIPVKPPAGKEKPK
jgi:tetratricopeptide (TPR) repeat protein